MALGKVRLQTQGLIGIETRFVTPSRYRVGTVIQPALHHRKTGKGERKIWVELDGLFEKRLRPANRMEPLRVYRGSVFEPGISKMWEQPSLTYGDPSSTLSPLTFSCLFLAPSISLMKPLICS